MKRLFCVIPILGSILLLQGCAAIFHTQHTALACWQDSTDVTYSSSEVGMWWGEVANTLETEHAKMRGKIADISLNNNKTYYLIKQSKKGFIPEYSIITRRRFNLLKVIDLALPVISDIYLLSGAGYYTDPVTGEQQSNIVPLALSYYFGTVGWLQVPFGPWVVYNRRYALPPMTPIPRHDTNVGRIFIKEVDVNINKDSLQHKYYETYNKFINHNMLYASREKDSFRVRNTVFKDTLNSILGKWKFIDTGRSFLSFMYSAPNFIRCEISGMTIYSVNALSYISLSTKWKLYGATSDKEAYSANLENTSKWGTFQEGDEEFKEYVTDALERSMAQFLTTNEVENALRNKSAKISIPDTWSTLQLSCKPSDIASNLQDALKATVTVKVPYGHGSGCVVSSDGYIITNYHVIADDTTSLVQVIFSSGDTLPAEYVRSNSVYDLALFKIRKPGNYECFTPSSSKDILLGTEVYAIGTPLDMSLGQTITKGIISGKRKIADKTIIQTDVSINPGNSGGGLINGQGKLLGIVNAKIMGEDIQGIGFAIPAYYIEDALKVKFNN